MRLQLEENIVSRKRDGTGMNPSATLENQAKEFFGNLKHLLENYELKASRILDWDRS